MGTLSIRVSIQILNTFELFLLTKNCKFSLVIKQ